MCGLLLSHFVSNILFGILHISKMSFSFRRQYAITIKAFLKLGIVAYAYDPALRRHVPPPPGLFFLLFFCM